MEDETYIARVKKKKKKRASIHSQIRMIATTRPGSGERATSFFNIAARSGSLASLLN